MARDRIKNEVIDAAHAAENASNWGTAVLRRVWEHGVDVTLTVPAATKTKLGKIPGLGPKLVAVLESVKVHVDLAHSETNARE
jgi:hypothetical protein